MTVAPAPAPVVAPAPAAQPIKPSRRQGTKRPFLLIAYVLGYLVWSLGPVFVAIGMSFNAGRSRSQFTGLSLQWWYGAPFGDPTGSLFTDPVMLHAIAQTFVLALGTVVVAVPLGTAAGIGLHRWRGPIASATNAFVLGSFVLPELVLAVAILSLIGDLFTFIPLGTGAQLAGLISLQLCVPAILVRTRLAGLPRNLEEAAMDLGAPPLSALTRVVLPNLAPAVIVSAALVFANVVDDFVMVSYLSGSAATQPLSVRLYTSARAVPTPELNAAVTFLLVLTLLILAGALLVARRLSRTGELAATLTQL